MSNQSNGNTSLLRLPEVLKRTGLSRATIYQRQTDGTFPKAIKLGERSIAWPDNVIEDWIQSRIARAGYEQ